MKKTTILIALLGMTLGTLAQKADYNVVPLPRNINVTDTVTTFTLRDGDVISYPTGNEELARNAAFLHEYVEETCGIHLDTKPGAKQAAITFSLGTPSKKKRPTTTTNDKPGAYTISITKKGIALTANEGEGIFRAIQTLRKSLPINSSKSASTVSFDLATISDAPRFAYRGQMLDCARHFFPVEYIKRHRHPRAPWRQPVPLAHHRRPGLALRGQVHARAGQGGMHAQLHRHRPQLL